MMGDTAIGNTVMPDERATGTLAADIAAWAMVGDVIALSGGLGAGKTTFARAFIRAFCDEPDLEVPSPTFTLMQTYTQGRFPLAHLDLYRIADARELDELGFDELSGDDGAALIEWPDRALERLPVDRLDIVFEVDESGHSVRLEPGGNWVGRLARTVAIRRFLEAAGWNQADRRHLQGDVSIRRYERVTKPEASAILMDWPPAAPGPGSYNARVGRAWEVSAFVDIADALIAAGLSAPRTYRTDIRAGLLLLEDFGAQGIADNGRPDPQRYASAVAVLAEIHRRPRARQIAAGQGGERTLPVYDGAVLATEAQLFAEHFVPFAGADALAPAAVADFRRIWSLLGDVLAQGEKSWVLRDFHSPNLMWLPDRQGIGRVGLLDIQDALFGPPAYDVASLLQDARITIAPGLEADLMSVYLELRQQADSAFDSDAFRAAYSIVGAQRAMKVLGIFARLSIEEGREAYLAHIPRLREYLRRNLSHPVLSDLALWYEEYLPRDDQAV